MRKIKLFINTHTLRWLFYRKNIYWFQPRVTISKYTYQKVCSNCKYGSNGFVYFMSKHVCLNCQKEYIEVLNESFGYLAYLLLKKLNSKIEILLDWLHILRKRNIDRYGYFDGDERYLIKHLSFNTNDKEFKIVLRKRKWYEYLIVKK